MVFFGCTLILGKNRYVFYFFKNLFWTGVINYIELNLYKMSKFTILICIVLLPIIGFSQEICNNGIDDDGDGLIDFNDTQDCNCSSVFSVTNIANLICTEVRTFSVYADIQADTYQWYRNKVAMTNERDRFLVLFDNHEGLYNLVVSTGGLCSISKDIIVDVPDYKVSISDTFCLGSIYTFAEYMITLPGTYYKTFKAINGCDSIITLNLFGIDCGDTILVKDKNFKLELIKLGVDKNGDKKLQYAEAFSIDSIYIDQKNQQWFEKIGTLNGLDAFKNLRHLTIKNTGIHSLNVNKLSKLEYLDASNNTQYLDEIYVDSCLTLKHLDVSWSQTIRLNLKNNFNLETFVNESSRIRDTLNFVNSPNLKKIVMLRNLARTAVLFDKNTKLQELYMSGYPFNKFDLRGNPNLEIVQCNQCNTIADVDFSKNKNLKFLSMFYNKLDSIDLKNNELLEWVDLSNSEKLKTIDLSNKPKLKHVNITSSSKCTEFIINNCPGLHRLECLGAKFKSLDLSGSYVLDSLKCGGLDYLNIKNGTVESHLDIWSDIWMKHICVDEAQLEQVRSKIYKDVSVNSYCSFEPTGKSYSMYGKVQFDSNGDGCNLSDPNIKNIRFFIENTQAEGFVSTGINNDYRILVPEGKNAIKPTIENFELFKISPDFIELDLPKDSILLNQNICVIPNILKSDISVRVIPLTDARPGEKVGYKIKLDNGGSVSSSGMLTLYKPGKLNFLSSDISTSLISKDSITWQFENVKPFESKEFLVTFLANKPNDPEPMDLGDTLLLTGVVRSQNDVNLNNNSHLLKQIVVNSFDPNDKICLEGNLLKQHNIGEFIHYLIRFENLGNANAINVVVRDAIDTLALDINSIEFVDVSHRNVKLRTHSKHILEFIFENINLSYLDSLNDGYVLFKVKLKTNLGGGDSVVNKAEIYFDFNKPIITNEYLSVVDQEVISSTDNHYKQLYNIFPNPTDGIVNITNIKSVKNIRLIDLAGNSIYTISDFIKEESLLTFGINKIPSGMYLIQIFDETGTYSLHKILIK